MRNKVAKYFRKVCRENGQPDSIYKAMKKARNFTPTTAKYKRKGKELKKYLKKQKRFEAILNGEYDDK